MRFLKVYSCCFYVFFPVPGLDGIPLKSYLVTSRLKAVFFGRLVFCSSLRALRKLQLLIQDCAILFQRN